MFGKEPLIRFTVRVFRGRMSNSVYVLLSHIGIKGRL